MGLGGIKSLSSNLGGGGDSTAHYPNFASLPVAPALGTLAITDDTGQLWSFTTSGWTTNTNALSYPIYETGITHVFTFAGSTNTVLGGTLSIQMTQATDTTAGWLDPIDYNYFNDKQDPLGYTAMPFNRGSISVYDSYGVGGSLFPEPTAFDPIGDQVAMAQDTGLLYYWDLANLVWTGSTLSTLPISGLNEVNSMVRRGATFSEFTSGYQAIKNSYASGITGAPTTIDTVNPNTMGQIIKGSFDAGALASGTKFLASYDASLDADYSAGVGTGTPVGGAAIVSGYLDLTGSGNRYVDYSGVANADTALQTGAIRLTYQPAYSGVPSAFTCIFAISAGSGNAANLIELFHYNGTGELSVVIQNSAAGALLTGSYGNWTTNVAGTDYVIEFDYNNTTGAQRLFINGIQFGSTTTATGTRSGAVNLIRVGAAFDGSFGAEAKYKDLVLFDSVQHTTNHSAELPFGYGTQLVDLSQFQDYMGNVLARIDKVGVFRGSVANTPSGNLSSDTVQGALNELQTEVDGKQNALTFYPVAESTSSVLQITGITGQIPGATLQIQVNAASGLTSGFLGFTHWNTFNQKQGPFNGIDDSTKLLPVYNQATQVFGVTVSPNAYVYVGGNRFTAITENLPAHGLTTGQWYFYYNSGGTLTASQNFWDLLTTAPLASVYYNSGTTAGILYDERHPATSGMDNVTHKYLHQTRGTQVVSGFAVSGYTLSTAGITALSYAVDSGVIADEDLYLTLSAKAKYGPYRHFYLDGSNVLPTWNWSSGSTTGILGNGTNLYYNQLNGSTWQLTPITANNTWINYYIFAMDTLDLTKGIVSIVGQQTHGTLALAQSEDPLTAISSISNLTGEGAYLAKLSYRRVSGSTPENAQLNSVINIRVNTLSASGSTPVNHNSLSGRSDANSHPASAISNVPSGNLAATDLQTAVDELQTDINSRLPYTGSTLYLFNGATTSMSLLAPALISGYTLSWPIAQGATNTFMKNDGVGGMTWAPSYISRVCAGRQTSAFTCGTAVFGSEVVFNSEILDSNSEYDTSTGRFTPKQAGNYKFTFDIVFNSAATTTSLEAFVFLNGTAGTRKSYSTVNTPPSSATPFSITIVVNMNGTTDYVSLWAQSGTTSGAIDPGSAGAPSSFINIEGPL